MRNLFSAWHRLHNLDPGTAAAIEMSSDFGRPSVPLSKAVFNMEIDPPVNPSVAAGNGASEDWRKALTKVVSAVVVLRTTATRAFDTEAAGAHYATGFVVDKRRGILLTNRHVVRPGMCDLHIYHPSSCVIFKL